MELDVLSEHELALAFVLERDGVRDELPGLQRLDDGFLVDRDRNGGLVAAVEDRGNAVVAANGARAATARAFTHVDIENDFGFSHFTLRFALMTARLARSPWLHRQRQSPPFGKRGL
jgi:hypothetical protein